MPKSGIGRSTADPVLARGDNLVATARDVNGGLCRHRARRPRQVAAVIFDLSRGDDLPEQLVLGSDALARIAQNDVVRSTAAVQWNEVNRSTDFDEDATPLRLLD
ncbi:hypothetical protein QN219_15310 [Sinorhizobium sp. 7-81]|uniref:hypothetical protein n=1 Tax=Sinorhizobium sp. 8-89 TaxID=3049089 RepID=UPI0024C3C36E|nr:hypothetical protein [Sinorhizobium sp. 8-89]MDK1491411.1 hypothetical protein [Sinorhizobium sp. 8-89]